MVDLCVDEGDRVFVHLYYLHDHAISLSLCIPWIHQPLLRRVRRLLHVLSLLGGLQAELEAGNLAASRRPGGATRAFKRVLDPILYHDACTLYLASMWDLFGGSSSAWFRSGTPCERCGEDAWGVTCTPPALTRHGMRRDACDDMIGFCWACLSRRCLV